MNYSKIIVVQALINVQDLIKDKYNYSLHLRTRSLHVFNELADFILRV
jgi:hypothetical protein